MKNEKRLRSQKASEVMFVYLAEAAAADCKFLSAVSASPAPATLSVLARDLCPLIRVTCDLATLRTAPINLTNSRLAASSTAGAATRITRSDSVSATIEEGGEEPGLAVSVMRSEPVSDVVVSQRYELVEVVADGDGDGDGGGGAAATRMNRLVVNRRTGTVNRVGTLGTLNPKRFIPVVSNRLRKKSHRDGMSERW